MNSILRKVTPVKSHTFHKLTPEIYRIFIAIGFQIEYLPLALKLLFNTISNTVATLGKIDKIK